MKQLKIRNRGEGHRAINAIGDNEAKIKRLKAENKKLLQLVEEWATENPDEAFTSKNGRMEDETDRYAYHMAKDNAALRMQSHLTVEDVVARLGATPETEQYVVTTYDSDEIKADFGSSAAKRKKVEDFGLYFTEPRHHLKVDALEGTALRGK